MSENLISTTDLSVPLSFAGQTVRAPAGGARG